MRQILLSILLLNFIPVYAQTTYPSGVTGCIARYDFSNPESSDSLPDVSGNGHTGAIYDLANDAGFKNISNTAMHFNGSTSYAQVANSSQLCPSQMTIVALVKLDTFYSQDCQQSQIIIKGYPYEASGVYHLGVGDGAYDNDCSAYSPDNMQLNCGFGTLNYIESAGNYVQLHKWYLYATTYDGNTLKEYQVGMDTSVYESSISPITFATGLSTPIGTNTSDIIIGHTFNPPYPFWVTGTMDELVLFNKVLSDTDMESIYRYLWSGTTGIANVSLNNKVQIYPNPSKGTFTIQGNINSQKDATIELKNLLGQTIYTDVVSVQNGQVNKQVVLDASVANGVYMICINSDEQKITQRIIINR